MAFPNSFRTKQKDAKGRSIFKDRDTGTLFTVQNGKQIVGRPGTSAPKSTAAKSSTPQASLAGTLKDGRESKTAGLGSMANFQIALKGALNEAAGNRTAANFGAFDQAGLVGKTPGTLSSVVAMIRSGAQTDASSIFESAVEGYKYERENSLELLKTFAEDGSLALMPDSALQSLGASAGIDASIVAGWKQRITAATEISDQRAQLEIQQVRAQIGETLANTSRIRERTRASGAAAAGGNAGGGSPGFVDDEGNFDPSKVDSSTIFLASQYEGIENIEDQLSFFNNLPATNKKNLADYLGTIAVGEQNTPEGVGRKLAIGRVQPGGIILSDNELRIDLFGLKDGGGDLQTAYNYIAGEPISNKDRARSIARDIWQPSQAQPQQQNQSIAPNQSNVPNQSIAPNQSVVPYDLEGIGSNINSLWNIPSIFKL